MVRSNLWLGSCAAVLCAVSVTLLWGNSARAQACRKLTETVPKRAKPAAVQSHNEAVLARVHAGQTQGEELAWQHLVVHHTASVWSTVARIHGFHCQKFEDPDGIEYHFLIGNGRNMPDGYIAEGRWPLQKRSIHLFHPERAPEGIAIALVGNFEERKPSRAQTQALVKLLTALAARYKIPVEKITTHKRVDGRLTQCPGRKFPLERVQSRVQQALSPPPSPPPTAE